MGLSRTPAEMAGKIRAAGVAIEKQRAKQLDTLGVTMKAEAARAVASDIGGNSFSGWKNAPLLTEAKKMGSNGLRFAPVGRAKGPFRVAEVGRHAGMHGPMQGPIAVKLTKSGRARKRQPGRKKWNGVTKGKGTWTTTVNRISKVVPDKLRDGFVTAAREVFR